MTRWQYLYAAYLRPRYHLGLTHQFSCEHCGGPKDEIPSTDFAGKNMWQWHCAFCLWRSGGGHAPRVMKRQHRRVVAIRKAWWWAKFWVDIQKLHIISSSLGFVSAGIISYILISGSDDPLPALVLGCVCGLSIGIAVTAGVLE